MLGLAEKPSTPRKVKPPPPKGKDKKSKQKTPSLPPKSRERSKPPTRQTVPGTAVRLVKLIQLNKHTSIFFSSFKYTEYMIICDDINMINYLFYQPS